MALWALSKSGVRQGSKCPSLPGFTHWVNPGKPGLGFKPYFGKSGEYWVIKYFKCSDVQNCANWWISWDIEASKIIKNIEHMSIKSIHSMMGTCYNIYCLYIL